MLRLGFTESTLLYLYFLENILKIHPNNGLFYELQRNMLNWLLSTSGYYDKTIPGTNMNFNTLDIKKSETYHTYFRKLINIIRQSNYQVLLWFHEMPEKTLSYKNKFNDFFMNKIISYFDSDVQKIFHTFIENKKLLVINNLGKLFKQQVDNGNIYKIFIDFPKIETFNYFENGYSFVNNGPDKNLLETANKNIEKIDSLKIDCNAVVISAGAYSILYAEYFIKKNIPVFILGGDLAFYFGIKIKRHYRDHSYFFKNLTQEQKNLFLSVPKSMIPPNADKVESGCYW